MRHYKYQSKNKGLARRSTTEGFTLIELLVVVSIISLLSSIVFASLNGARVKARDASRKIAMKQVQTALELYYNSNNAYPANPTWWGACPSYGGHPTSGVNGYIPNLAPTYISTLPLDPRPCSNGDGYLYYSDGNNYKLLSHFSPESFPAAGQVFYDPYRPTYSWMICSAEPACSGW
ncbi:MAG: type II secretion system protein [Candidatus Paceibacterota bacterium]